MPIATTPDQLALQASLRDWAKRAAPLAAVRRLEPGAPVPAENGYLSDLAGLGLFSVAVPEAAGGAGGTLTDLAAALEQLTVTLVPGPVLPTALAGLLLASANATALLPALAAGQATAAVALTPGRLAGGRQAGGTLRVTGPAGPVLGAGTTSHLLLGTTTDDGEAWFWITAGHPALAVTPRRPLDFSRSLADVTLTDAAVPEDQLISGLDTARVRDLAATTCAAEAAGVAAWCCATAADYARTRRQFGRVIGEFQAVKHLCATMACRAERAAALAWDAARAADEAPAEHPLAAAAAAALVLDDAVENAKDCIQVLGGIGFTWEHDAHVDNAWHYPMGLATPAAMVAMVARRYMHCYGATSEDFGRVTVADRRHAATNPRAWFYQRPVTLAEHQASRWIVEPLRLLDCCQESDGAVAVVVTSADRARNLPQPHAVIRAAAQGAGPDQYTMTSYYRDDLTGLPELGVVARQLWHQAGIVPADIRTAILYDHFTPYVLMQLEELGFCSRGEARDFIAGDAIEMGGRLPLNPHGGQLGEAYIHGMNGIAEAVRQVRGTSVNQVPGDGPVLVTAGTGVPTSGLILSPPDT